MSGTLIFGAEGLLGRALDLQCAERGPVWAPKEQELDLRDEAGVKALTERLMPALVINTAAIVDVARCERDPDLAHGVHVDGAANAAQASVAAGARHILVSTDYVFGSHPDGGLHSESDPTGPLNEYGHTKLAGEQRVLEVDPDSLVVRVGILFGHGRPTAVWRMAEEFLAGRPVDVYDDVHGSPTDTAECAKHIIGAADARLNGVVHAVGHGQANRYEMACLVRRWADREDLSIHRSSWRQRSPVDCPRYAGLRNACLAEAGIDSFTHWDESIPRFLDELRAVGSLSVHRQ